MNNNKYLNEKLATISNLIFPKLIISLGKLSRFFKQHPLKIGIESRTRFLLLGIDLLRFDSIT